MAMSLPRCVPPSDKKLNSWLRRWSVHGAFVFMTVSSWLIMIIFTEYLELRLVVEVLHPALVHPLHLALLLLDVVAIPFACQQAVCGRLYVRFPEVNMSIRIFHPHRLRFRLSSIRR